MRRKILIITYVLLTLILLKLVATLLINEKFISDYNNEEYNEDTLKILSIINFPQSYILYYNQGNALYQKGEYKEAIEKYYKALEKNPPQNKECSIRINLALAKLKEYNDDETEENKKQNIEILNSARNILCENGCANSEDSNGHSEEAEKLKKDIDDKLKELQQEDDEENEQENSDEDSTTSSEENSKSKTEKQEEELKELQQESLKERQEQLSADEKRYDGTYNYIYYDGKRW